MDQTALQEAPIVPFVAVAEPPPLTALASLYRKMGQVMGEVHRLSKSARNDFAGFDYTPSEDIKDQIRPLLARYGIALHLRLTGHERLEEGKLKITRVSVVYTLADVDTGATIETPWLGEAANAGDKGLYVAIAYATKYFLAHTFLISWGEEPDGDATPPEHLASPALLKSIVQAHRALFPDSKLGNEEVLAEAFGKVCGRGATRSQDNAAKVMLRLFNRARVAPAPTADTLSAPTEASETAQPSQPDDLAPATADQDFPASPPTNSSRRRGRTPQGDTNNE